MLDKYIMYKIKTHYLCNIKSLRVWITQFSLFSSNASMQFESKQKLHNQCNYEVTNLLLLISINLLWLLRGSIK